MPRAKKSAGDESAGKKSYFIYPRTYTTELRYNAALRRIRQFNDEFAKVAGVAVEDANLLLVNLALVSARVKFDTPPDFPVFDASASADEIKAACFDLLESKVSALFDEIVDAVYAFDNDQIGDVDPAIAPGTDGIKDESGTPDPNLSDGA